MTKAAKTKFDFSSYIFSDVHHKGLIRFFILIFLFVGIIAGLITLGSWALEHVPMLVLIFVGGIVGLSFLGWVLYPDKAERESWNKNDI